MVKLTATRGLPGSLKTTWAESIENDGAVLVSRDDIRQMLFGGWTGDHADEELVNVVQQAAIKGALKKGRDVVVHDTNLRRVYLKRLAIMAAECDAEFVIKDFTHVPVDTCIANVKQRVAKGGRHVDENIIRDMHQRYLTRSISLDFSQEISAIPSAEPYTPVHGTPTAFIIDIDGTVASHEGIRDPYDTSKYHLDNVNWPVLETLQVIVNCFTEDLGFAADASPVLLFTTGRHEEFRDVTQQWLDDNILNFFPDSEHSLIMRQNQGRRDDIEKLDMFNTHIRDHYSVISAWDDRDRVVKMWRSIGIQTFQVADGDF